jgi:hypothetical protein
MEKEVSKDNGLMFIRFDNQKIPEFKEVRGKDWVYWGEKNEYPDYLIELFMRSSTHNAIITGKVNYILGNGWVSDKNSATITNQAILNSLIDNINSGQSLNELSEEFILDFEIFNAIALEVIWDKTGRSFELHHIPFNKLRTNSDKSKYYYSRDWSSANQSEEKTGLKEFEPFNFEGKKKGSFIYVYQITSPRKGKDPNVYPMPEYIGSTQAIETDLECSNYNLSEIKTGFSAGTILNFYNGVPEPEAKKAIEKQIINKFSGTDRAGSMIINFADGKDRGSDVTSLNGNDLDKRYIELKKDVRQEIFTGHKVSSPMLFGVKTEGQLGGRSEIQEAYELFQNTYISRRQRIIEKILNKFVKLKGITGSIKLTQTSAIGIAIPDSIVEKVYPFDIAREKLGFPIDNTTPNQTNTTTVNMAKLEPSRDVVLLELSKIGREKSLFHILKSNEIHDSNYYKIKKSEKDYFAADLSTNEKAVIDLINKDNKIPSEEIAKALKLSVKEVESILNSLIDSEYLSSTKTGYKPTSEALAIIENEGVKTANVELLYSYELRSNALPLSEGGSSRPFCVKMMEGNKLYTRKEIDSLSNGMGLDVWTYKGGWYTNPKTDAPTPQCRHTWVQHVTKLK